jgi:excisionase family DNA binding protein
MIGRHTSTSLLVEPTSSHLGVTVETALRRVEEAAKYLPVGRTTMCILMSRGAVPTVQIGSAGKIPTDALKALVRNRSHAGGQVGGLAWALDERAVRYILTAAPEVLGTPAA